MATDRFLTDEHIPNAVVLGLRARGIDALTAKEGGTRGASDSSMLDHSVIITQDADFLRLHAAGIEHAGIVYVAPETAIGEMIRGAPL